MNLDQFRKDTCSQLNKIVSNAGGIGIKNKIMVFDPDLMSSINLTVGISILREWGVVSFHYLEQDNIIASVPNQKYIIRSEAENCNLIIKHIDINKKLKEKKHYHIVFLPKKSIQCERIFERAGVWSDVTISELNTMLIPIGTNLLSMEYSKVFRKVWLDQDYTPLFTIVDSLIDLQEKFGIIPVIQGIGNYSKFIIDEMLKVKTSEDYIHSAGYRHITNILPQIGRMIIIDRECDYITPLITQLEYTGLIDENIGIQDNSIKMDKIIKLNSNDPVYKLLCDLEINDVYSILREKLKEHSLILKELDQGKNERNMSIIKTSTKKLELLEKQVPRRLLVTHLNIAQTIDKILIEPYNVEAWEIERNLVFDKHNFIDQVINKSKYEDWLLNIINNKYLPLTKILRIICLYCIVNDGINLKSSDVLRKAIISNFGHKYVFTIENLFNVGLLHPPLKEYEGSWDLKKEYFSLFSNYYSPLSCRIIEYALTKSFKSFTHQKSKDILYNGRWLDTNNKTFNLVQSFDFNKLNDQQINDIASVVLVYFVGGITYSEISALKLLLKLNPDKQIIIATTKIINGNYFIESLY